MKRIIFHSGRIHQSVTKACLFFLGLGVGIRVRVRVFKHPIGFVELNYMDLFSDKLS